MQQRAPFLIAFVWVAVIIASIGGCTRSTPPTDEEILRAIDESGTLKGKGFTITSPVIVVEKGKRNADGSWPVKVKMTMTMQLPGGKISEPRENMPVYRIYKARNKDGQSVWMAALGS